MQVLINLFMNLQFQTRKNIFWHQILQLVCKNCFFFYKKHLHRYRVITTIVLFKIKSNRHNFIPVWILNHADINFRWDCEKVLLIYVQTTLTLKNNLYRHLKKYIFSNYSFINNYLLGFTDNRRYEFSLSVSVYAIDKHMK